MALLGRLQGILFGGAIGAAASDAIAPQLEPAKQHAWQRNKNRVLGLEAIARLLAQALISEGSAEEEAGRTGYNANRVRALAALEQKAPTQADAQDLRRRGKISRDQLEHAFAKAQIEPQYWDALADLVDERLSPQAVAYAIVRGLVDDQGILPVPPPTAPGKVPAFPRYGLNAVAEAASSGYNKERLSVLVGSSGRPMSPEAAALAVFKGIIEHQDYARAVGEGDVRNEWADAIFENARFVLSPQDAAGLHLRGWIDKPTMYEIGGLHGASPATMDRLFLNRGRPAAPGQMANAIVRGIDGPLNRPMDREQFLMGIAQSDIRPEWGPMLYESFFLYPSLFQLNRLVTSGIITAEVGALWAKKARYAPEVITALEGSWSTPSGPAEAKWASRARSRLFTVAHNEYLDGSIDEARARGVLELVGASANEINNIIGLWDSENAIARLGLTPAQIKKAYRRGDWTLDEALATLEDRGMTDADARELLAE